MGQQHPAGRPDRKQAPAGQTYSAAKVLDLAQSIYNLPASSRADIEAYVQMRVLLDRLVMESRYPDNEH